METITIEDAITDIVLPYCYSDVTRYSSQRDYPENCDLMNYELTSMSLTVFITHPQMEVTSECNVINIRRYKETIMSYDGGYVEFLQNAYDALWNKVAGQIYRPKEEDFCEFTIIVKNKKTGEFVTLNYTHDTAEVTVTEVDLLKDQKVVTFILSLLSPIQDEYRCVNVNADVNCKVKFSVSDTDHQSLVDFELAGIIDDVFKTPNTAYFTKRVRENSLKFYRSQKATGGIVIAKSNYDNLLYPTDSLVFIPHQRVFFMWDTTTSYRPGSEGITLLNFLKVYSRRKDCRRLGFIADAPFFHKTYDLSVNIKDRLTIKEMIDVLNDPELRERLSKRNELVPMKSFIVTQTEGYYGVKHNIFTFVLTSENVDKIVYDLERLQ